MKFGPFPMYVFAPIKTEPQAIAAISRNAQPATAYFNLPPGRVVELGMQIDL